MSMTDKKLLFTPETKSELLNGWLIHAHKGRDRHNEASRRYEQYRYWLGVPTLSVSTVVGTSVFSALSTQEAPALWVAILSVLAAVLTALQTFLNFPALADRHRGAAVKYKAVIREIEQHTTDMNTQEKLAEELISAIRVKLDTLEDEAPVVTSKIYDKIEEQYKGAHYVQEAIHLYKK